MERRFIPVEEAFGEWRKDPDYVAAYDALDKEFSAVPSPIKNRTTKTRTSKSLRLAKVFWFFFSKKNDA